MKTTKTPREVLIILRHADIGDVSSYARIAKKNESRTYWAITDPVGILGEISDSNVFMIEYEGQTVGFISYEWRSETEAYISELAIDPSWGSRGIGRKTFQMLVDCLRLEGTTSLSIHTHPDNEGALSIYTGNGFEPRDRIENYNGTGEPRLLLARELEPIAITPARCPL